MIRFRAGTKHSLILHVFAGDSLDFKLKVHTRFPDEFIEINFRRTAINKTECESDKERDSKCLEIERERDIYISREQRGGWGVGQGVGDGATCLQRLNRFQSWQQQKVYQL